MDYLLRVQDRKSVDADSEQDMKTTNNDKTDDKPTI